MLSIPNQTFYHMLLDWVFFDVMIAFGGQTSTFSGQILRINCWELAIRSRFVKNTIANNY
jgi:hypothetical protein